MRICPEYRKFCSHYFFLPLLDEEVNVIRGLDGGGDDYITKPFKLGELISRINALFTPCRCIKNDNNNFIKYGDISIDFQKSRVTVNEKY